MCKLGRWIKGLFVETVKEVAKEVDLCNLAEIALLTNPHISKADKEIIRQVIVTIKSGNVEETIIEQAKKRLKEVLDKYKNNLRGYLNSDPRD